MRSAAIILTVAVLAVGFILNLGDPRQTLGDNYKLEMPKEAFGFSGTLSAQVVKEPDKVYGWFEIKVVKVISFAPNNKTKIKSANALTKAWKDKCVAVLGVKDMAELKVGDMVTVVAANREVHLRATKVSKDEPVKAKPDDDVAAAEKAKKFPADVKTILEKADSFELLSLEPTTPNETPAESFHGWKVLGKKTVDEAEVRKTLVAAFEKGVEAYQGDGAACFNPRHGIKVKHGGKAADLVICFECDRVRAYLGGQNEHEFLVSRSPSDLFNKVLKDGGVELPAPPKD